MVYYYYYYSIMEWLVRLLNFSFDMGVGLMDWRGACVVSLYKGKVTNVNVATQEVLVKIELGPELNVQLGRSNVGLDRVDDAWTKWLP